jgi:acetoin utilization protein AcuC
MPRGHIGDVVVVLDGSDLSSGSGGGNVARMQCTGPAVIVWDKTLTGYDFGPTHPMSPLRVDLTMRLAEQLGVLEGVTVVGARLATEDEIATVHDGALIEAVTKAGTTPGWVDLARGLGTEDDPVFANMHLASAHVVGTSLEAFRQVSSGRALHAANIAGGLHHAMPDKASGFCIYNDVAVGIKELLANGAERVAYVDVDAHHGDGVETIFYDDPRVLTISLHETGQMLFPGTGFPRDTGGPGAEGSAVNVALPPGTGDAGWLRAFHAVVPPLVREFKPDVLVTQHGCDSHMDDPLAHLMLSVDGQRAAYDALHVLAHEVCDGKWVATGGGGYAVKEVVPRAWAHLLAIVAGNPIPPDTLTPEAWREHVAEVIGGTAPTRMSDGRTPAYRDWSGGYDPETWLDRAIHATRMETFPLHGLDPLP